MRPWFIFNFWQTIIELTFLEVDYFAGFLFIFLNRRIRKVVQSFCDVNLFSGYVISNLFINDFIFSSYSWNNLRISLNAIFKAIDLISKNMFWNFKISPYFWPLFLIHRSSLHIKLRYLHKWSPVLYLLSTRFDRVLDFIGIFWIRYLGLNFMFYIESVS